jgi:ABC transporter substrate binding protein
MRRVLRRSIILTIRLASRSGGRWTLWLPSSESLSLSSRSATSRKPRLLSTRRWLTVLRRVAGQTGSFGLRLAELSLRRGVPGAMVLRQHVEAGGLMSYFADIGEHWNRVAAQVDRILRGSGAEELPIEQPTKFELIINLKTAKALGLTIPPTLLARADEVIE